MYVYQNGKLYRQDGEKLVGVEIYSDKVLLIEGTETTIAEEHKMYSHYEVRCKFQTDAIPYIFPREPKEELKVEAKKVAPKKAVKQDVKVEVDNNEPTKSVRKTKTTPRKSTRK